ncbi:hypothetical protein O4G76_20065 [Limimaricola sp. G21655-S1]|uniref:hypothetical protein n=1 Tax=Limimaricola sp. G21655-S1 TaxID=3014768 RepID=UPI0022AFAD5E|nr:hypothetical protein [Limimaricola sp. G21655-S1]MCZ4263121.1 hypothetical protein [Limimaricola sp. G21655-S1]
MDKVVNDIQSLLGETDPQLHYYCFSFLEAPLSASIYIGYRDQQVTLNKISKAKKEAGVSQQAVLLAVSYLGHMTYSKMTDS